MKNPTPDPFLRLNATAKAAADLRDPATRESDRLNELLVLRKIAAASKEIREHTDECITAMAANGFVCGCENLEQTERLCEAIADWEMLQS